MRIDEALDAGMKTFELRGAPLSDFFNCRQLIHALSAAKDRDEQIAMLRVCGNDTAAREIERIDDHMRRLAGELVEDHVRVVEPAHLQLSRSGGLDRLLGHLDAVLPLPSSRPERRQFVNAA